ncbi:MAG: nuoA [Nitrospira sp.]|jgi:NADH-quinone oxidoreductase subunit A|nr:nuoA [Nitrospira sp.]
MDEQLLWPVVVFGLAVFSILAVMIGLPALLGERHGRKPGRRAEIGTNEPYESGIRPTGTAQIRLPIQYYLIAMLFVIFDLEAVFLYAWAVAVRETGWFGFIEAAIFAAVLLAALAYLWRIGALNLTVKAQHRPTQRLNVSKAQEARDALVA